MGRALWHSAVLVQRGDHEPVSCSDVDEMPRFHTCEVACAVSHQENQDCAALSPDEFISRIRVIKDHSWTTAVACHQCEDAPCANVCPVDAISREHGHIFVEQTRSWL